MGCYQQWHTHTLSKRTKRSASVIRNSVLEETFSHRENIHSKNKSAITTTLTTTEREWSFFSFPAKKKDNTREPEARAVHFSMRHILRSPDSHDQNSTQSRRMQAMLQPFKKTHHALFLRCVGSCQTKALCMGSGQKIRSANFPKRRRLAQKDSKP